MIDSKKLLSDLQKFVRRLEEDLRARCDTKVEVNEPLRAAYGEARRQNRTASTYAAWRAEELTNVAVAWVLATVFIRFLEDNELIEPPYLAGPGPRLQRAKDEHEIFFRQNPRLTEREYLEKVFADVGALPAMKEFFDSKHNPLWQVAPSGDAAKELLDFWRKTDPETGALLHDFTDPEWDTRFLGDLYQDLSEFARKRYALLQTPVFIEQFILDRTLTPAIQTFGYQIVRMIDPTCGSGHFLLGGFDRLFRLWQQNRPGENPRVLVQKALDQVYGVDLNPNVVAIARFRLLLVALRACGVKRIKDAPDFRIHVAAGDSLLHGRRFRAHETHTTGPQRTFDTEEVFRDELKHHYEVEDVEALHRILGQPYHAVVGNPPYIAVKDRAVSELYRARFPSCHGRYSLSAPFMERFFDLAVKGDGTPQQPAGFVGQITSNSFMKREFGKKLIEEYLPHWDLTHVLDTAGAYIPGHGTPTVILFGKNQPPVSSTIRTVLGIRGEPDVVKDAAEGRVWQAILRQVDDPGSQSEWVSAADSPRQNFHKHPWSVGGGGAAELKDEIDDSAENTIDGIADEIGITAVTGEDDLFVLPQKTDLLRLNVELTRTLVTGDPVREWQIIDAPEAIWLYDSDLKLLELNSLPFTARLFWVCRTSISKRRRFGTPMVERGLRWYEWQELYRSKFSPRGLITWPEVSTHNHFVFDAGCKVFKNSTPVIKLKGNANEDDHVRLLGVLNSSTACFWMKQVCQNKGAGGGSRVDAGYSPLGGDNWESHYAFNATKIARLPIPAHQPTQLPTALVQTSTALQAQSPAATLASWSGPESGELRTRLATARDQATRLRRQLIAWQEELDWQIYEAFGLVEGAEASGPAAVSLPEGEAMDRVAEFGLELGERAFEIVLARHMAAGEARPSADPHESPPPPRTTWFERHGSTPLTELPRHWPAAYRELVERRLRRIADDPAIRLIEQPEYKRRWNTEPWDEQFTKAARDWLLARLEGYFHEGQRVCELKDGFDPAGAGFTPATRPAITTTNQLAGIVQADAAFLAVAEQLKGAVFSVPKLVRDLVESASVPFLPVRRYKPSGLLKRQDWEQVWELQREEDRIYAAEKVNEPGIPDDERTRRKLAATTRKKTELGDIPVPPKYANSDFKKSVWWSLRGKLDVPKERWISYPGAEQDGDPSPLIAWAGWNYLQQAQALAEYYLDAKNNQGWPATKLKLLLAGLLDLLPWLKQWHNEMDPDYGMGLGDYFAGFLDEECRALDLTLDEINDARFNATAPRLADPALTRD